MSQMADKLTLEILMSLTPISETGNDIVTTVSRDLLLSCIKTEQRVREIFFPHFTPNPLQGRLELKTFPMERLAVTFVAEAIANIKDAFRFHATINKAIVDKILRDIYESLQWKKMGFQIYCLVYPEIVKDAKTGVSLKDFMGPERCTWAERLMAHVQQPRWTRVVQQRIVRGLYSEEHFNRDMNALFVKLHLLDPQSVIPAYQFLLSQKALPAVNLELATRNYLGGRLDWRLIQFEVENAERKTTPPLNLSRLSLNSQVDVFHGSSVDDFVVTECRNLGLWSGLRPENVKVAITKRTCQVM